MRFKRDGDKIVVKAAEEKDDQNLLTRIRGYDLFACEANYHNSCKAAYVNYMYKKAEITESDKKHKKFVNDRNAAHKVAYETVVSYINKHIVCPKKLCKLTDLTAVYIRALSDTDFPSPDFRSDDLKSKLLNDEYFSNLISLVKVQLPRNICVNLVYSTGIDIGEAIAAAYKLANRDIHKQCAVELAANIKSVYKESKELPWPPTADDLKADDAEIPGDLLRFLTLLISGKDVNYSPKTERLAFSIRSDLCRAATIVLQSKFPQLRTSSPLLPQIH